MIKVMRDGKEIEIEEAERLDTDETVTNQDKKGISFTEEQQAHINSLLAKEKRDAQRKYETLNSEFSTYRSGIETKEREQEEALKTKLEEMKKGLSPIILNAVNRMTVQDAIEYLSDPENRVQSKTTPKTPQGKEEGEGKPNQKPLGTIF